MATTKYLKLPKKPKAGASVNQLSAWLKKVDEVKRINQARKREADAKKKLQARVAGIGAAYVIPSGTSVVRVSTRKKAEAAKPAKRKPAAKKAAKKRR